MQYTLDSVALIEKALMEKYKILKISTREVLLSPQQIIDSKLNGNNHEVFYFGVITFSNPDNNTLTIKDYQTEILTIDSNSQATTLIYDLLVNTQTSTSSLANGLFWGHEIILKGLPKTN